MISLGDGGFSINTLVIKSCFIESFDGGFIKSLFKYLFNFGLFIGFILCLLFILFILGILRYDIVGRDSF